MCGQRQSARGFFLFTSFEMVSFGLPCWTSCRTPEVGIALMSATLDLTIAALIEALRRMGALDHKSTPMISVPAADLIRLSIRVRRCHC